MIYNLNNALERYEKQVEDGLIRSFWIFLKKDGLLIKVADKELGIEQHVPLNEELMSSLISFFFEVASIEYGSNDYATLKSFINASLCINRLINSETKINHN